jgi:small GTP-binding protein
MKNEMKRTAISIVILGEQAVGKTMICSRFLGLEFRNEHLTTVGIEKMSKTIKIDTGEEIKLKLWDTAGQERFKSISLKNVRYSQAAVVVFDLTSKDSFEKVTEWLKQIRDNEPNMPISLFGNKSDLKEQRAVEQSDINTLCQNEKLEYFETSAKDNTGISEGFAKVASLGFKIFGNKTGGQKLVVKKKKKKCCKS